MCVCVSTPGFSLCIPPSVLPAPSLAPLAVSSWFNTICHQPVLQDPSENVFLRCCRYKELLLLCSFYSALPPFLDRFFGGSPVVAAFPCLAEESETVLLCFHPSQAASLLPAAEVVLAGARLVILSEISFILRIMMTKKKRN